MEEVVRGIDLEMPVDLIIVDLTNSYHSLTDILGKSYETSIIDRLFSKFCLGK
jgi:tRNA modification GTPase